MFAVAVRLLTGFSAEQMDEYRVKAAFLFNFAKFVDWPEDTSRDVKEPFAICVLGQDPFGKALDDVVAGKTIAGREVAVRRLTDARQAGGCSVVFVSPSASKRVLSTLTATQRGLLTVGDAGAPTSEGVVINFTMEGDKVRFEINMTAAEEGKIRLGSRLLSLATILRK